MATITVGTENNTPIELFFEDVGQGSPVILIHGWPLSGKSWEAQVPALVEAGHRVITYDRRGFGQSSRPWSGYDYDTFADDLAQLIDQLALDDVALVGFSMGGGEVARYVGRHGTGKLSKVVFAAAVPPFLFKSEDNPEGGLDDATIQQFQDGVTGDRPAFLRGFVDDFLAAGDKRDLASDELKHFLEILALPASPKGTLDCVDAFGRADFRADLEKLDVPGLVIHGDSDAIVPFEVSGKRTAQLPGVDLVVIEGGPHGLNATHVEPFNRALVDFLG